MSLLIVLRDHKVDYVEQSLLYLVSLDPNMETFSSQLAL